MSSYVSGSTATVSGFDTQIPKALPALARSQMMQRRASIAGFDWPDMSGPLEKLSEAKLLNDIEHQQFIDDEAARRAELSGSTERDDCGGSGPDVGCDGVCFSGLEDVGCGCGEDGPSGCDDACGSTAELDECGVCGGDGIADGACDCAGNVDLGCGCDEDGPSGCDNQCNSTAEFDECGECGGDAGQEEGGHKEGGSGSFHGDADWWVRRVGFTGRKSGLQHAGARSAIEGSE